MDEFDIYGDLHDIEKEAIQERQEVQELEQKIADLQAQLLAKEEEKQAIVQRNVILSENISSLLLTAKAELKRKDTIIADLRKQCDDTVFRRKHLQYKEVQRVSKCTQTYYVRQNHIGVQVEQAEDQRVAGEKKNDGGKTCDRDRDRDRQRDRDREKSSHRERDHVRERDRNRDRDKSQGLDRDFDRFRERDRHKDWHRDREKVQPRHREREQSGDRYRIRDSSGHRHNKERNEDRTREGNKDRKFSKERPKGYQQESEKRCDSRVVGTTTKSTEQTDKPLRIDKKTIHQEDSLRSKVCKTQTLDKHKTRKNSVGEVADSKERSHTPASQSTISQCDAINNRNEEMPFVDISKLHEENTVKHQLQNFDGECSETTAKEIVNKPVGKTVEIHEETYPRASSRLIDDCGIPEKVAIIFEQKNNEPGVDASVLENPIPSAIPAVLERTSDNEMDFQCQREQQKYVAEQTEKTDFASTVDLSVRADSGKLIESSRTLNHTDDSSLLSKSCQKKSRGAYESVEDAIIFEKMQDVCGEPHAMGDHARQEANDDSQAIDNQVASSSFLEHLLEGVEDVRNMSNGNGNVKDNEVFDEAANGSACISNAHKDGTVDVPLDNEQITKDSSDPVTTDGNVESVEQRAEISKFKRKGYRKISKSNKSSKDNAISTNIGDTADKTSTKITVDVHFLQDKSYNVEDSSVWKDHSPRMEEGAMEHGTSNLAIDKIDNGIGYANTNDEPIMVVDRGGLENKTEPSAFDVHLNSKIKSNTNQTTSVENEVLLAETLIATGETSVPKPSAASTHDSSLVTVPELAHEEAQTSAPIRLEENPSECHIEHVDEPSDLGNTIQRQQGMRSRSKSVCLDKFTFCRHDDEQSCDTLVCSSSKTEEAQLMSKTEEIARSRKTSDVVSAHVIPSKHHSKNSGADLKQHEKLVPLGNPDGSGSIRDRLRKMFCTGRPLKASRFSSGSNKRRLSLDSAPTVTKKQKAKRDLSDNSTSSTSSSSKLSDTFFSSIFLPIVSSLDNIHLKAESPTPNRACSMPSTPTITSMVVVHSPIKFACTSQRSLKGQETTQSLMDLLLLPSVKDEDDVEVEEPQGGSTNDRSRQENEVDNIRFSPQHLLASSTPLIVKPQSRLHHSTSSVPAVPSEVRACTAGMVAPNSKSWTAPSENPMPSGATRVTADKARIGETVNCRDTHNRKQKEQKRVVFVPVESDSKRPTSTSKGVHRKSGDERQICTPKSVSKKSNGADDAIVVSATVSKLSDKDRYSISPISIDKKSKGRCDSTIANSNEQETVSESLSKDVPSVLFKTPDVVKSGNRLRHTPSNTLSFVSSSLHESDEFITRQRQKQTPVNVGENGTPLTSRKRSRTSKSPKRRKIEVTGGEGISTGISPAELPVASNSKKRRMNHVGEVICKDSKQTNISGCPRNAILENTEGNVHVGEGEGTVDTIVEKSITNSSALKKSCHDSTSMNVASTSLVSVESVSHTTRSANSIEEEARAVATVKRSVDSQRASLNGPEQDTSTSLMSPMEGSATQKMCNFSLNLSLASTTTVEADTSAVPKSETPVRFIREMRIVKENPNLLRVYIKRRGE